MKKIPLKNKKSKSKRKRSGPGPVRNIIKGLTSKDQKQVLKYGPLAKPSFNPNGSETQRYSTFKFVQEIANIPNFTEEQQERASHLYACLLQCLESGDGSVFRDIADCVEAVSQGNKTKGVYPTHLAVHEAANPQPLVPFWGEDMISSVNAILSKSGIPTSGLTHLSNVRRVQRAKKDLGL